MAPISPERNFNASHLDCAKEAQTQSQATVKLHRVFLSRCRESASSRTCLFHRVSLRDSAQIVTPFVRVGTYPTRNFATLGLSELQPPFTGASVVSFFLSNNQLPLPSGTGQASAPIFRFTTLRRPVFLINSRLGLVTASSLTSSHPFSRSYGAILPSSLERVISRPLVFSTYLPVSVSGTGFFHCKIIRAFLGSLM
jgi:hypothetical protein